jgi:hypothetical protein
MFKLTVMCSFFLADSEISLKEQIKFLFLVYFMLPLWGLQPCSDFPRVVAGCLESLQLSPRVEVKLTYSPGDCLLTQLSYSTGELFTYTYDQMGRLASAVLPSGEIVPVSADRGSTTAQTGLWNKCAFSNIEMFFKKICVNFCCF